jgi:iron complex transport system substrate-binding protein
MAAVAAKQMVAGRWARCAAATMLAGMWACAGAAHASVKQQNTAPQSAAPTAAPNFREVTDETGRHVKVPVSVKRVVSLAPSLTETMYALGLQDILVGDTNFCDYPADAMKKHKVGGAINPNLEEVASLHPDLVLVTKGLNRLETVSALEQMGIPAYATDPHTVEEIVSSSRRLAEVLGAPAAGISLADELDARLAELKQRLAGVAPTRVLFVVWTEPLISVGQHTFVADALRYAGAVSIVESRQDWPQMSLEEVVHLQPEYLVFASSHSEGVRRDLETLAQRPGWKSLEAVKNRKFAVVSDAINRTAPRIVSAIEDLARQLHPEAFAPKQELKTPGENALAPAKPRSAELEKHSGPRAKRTEVLRCAL